MENEQLDLKGFFERMALIRKRISSDALSYKQQLAVMPAGNSSQVEIDAATKLLVAFKGLLPDTPDLLQNAQVRTELKNAIVLLTPELCRDGALKATTAYKNYSEFYGNDKEVVQHGLRALHAMVLKANQSKTMSGLGAFLKGK